MRQPRQLNDGCLKAWKGSFLPYQVDTGMRRIGLEPDEGGVEIVKKDKEFKGTQCKRPVYTSCNC